MAWSHTGNRETRGLPHICTFSSNRISNVARIGAVGDSAWPLACERTRRFSLAAPDDKAGQPR